MATLKGSETEKHLLAAFAGESQARDRYSIAAKIAKKEGYEQISGIFMETAENELEHAKLFFRRLEGGKVFKRPEKALWKRRNCGRVVEGIEAPDLCPTCQHPKAHFEVYAENY